MRARLSSVLKDAGSDTLLVLPVFSKPLPIPPLLRVNELLELIESQDESAENEDENTVESTEKVEPAISKVSDSALSASHNFFVYSIIYACRHALLSDNSTVLLSLLCHLQYLHLRATLEAAMVEENTLAQSTMATDFIDAEDKFKELLANSSNKSHPTSPSSCWCSSSVHSVKEMLESVILFRRFFSETLPQSRINASLMTDHQSCSNIMGNP